MGRKEDPLLYCTTETTVRIYQQPPRPTAIATTIMPRFSKPVQADANGEVIIPGAYQQAPGGVFERRPSIVWDNEERARMSAAGSDEEEAETEEVVVEEAEAETETEERTEPEEQEELGPRGSEYSEEQPQPGPGQHQTEPETQGDVEQALTETSGTLASSSGSHSCLGRSRESDAESQSQQASQQASLQQQSLEQQQQQQHSEQAPSTTDSQDTSIRKYMKGSILWPILAVVICAALIVVVVVLVVMIPQNSSAKTTSDNNLQDDAGLFAPPTELAYRKETSGIPEIVQQIISQDKLEPDWESPYFRTLYWILYQDDMLLNREEDSEDAIQQRYLMALFYFTTTPPLHQQQQKQKRADSQHRKKRHQRPSLEQSSWRHCTPTTNEAVEESGSQVNECVHQVLTSWSPLRYNTNPASYRWLSGVSECEWAGVTCSSLDHSTTTSTSKGLLQVTSIELANYGLSGTLVEELRYLTSLQTLSIPYNENLKGTIPSWTLQQLTQLELQSNRHTGVIDAGSQNAPSANNNRNRMSILNLAGNQLSGTLSPTMLQSWANLQELYLQGNNELSGTLPLDIFGQWSNLKHLQLERNKFYGRIPSFRSLSSQLRDLDLSDNQWTGEIPSEIGLATRLTSLRIAHTQQLNGSLPESLYNIASLRLLDLQDNRLKGTLSAQIGKLTNLREIYLQNNSMTGSLPSQLGRLSNIEEFWIHGNVFVGAVPTEFCALGDGGWPLAFSAEVVVDCAPGSGLNCPDGCCGTCCDKATRECTLNPSAILGITPSGASSNP